MAEALLKGLLVAKIFSPEQIVLSDPQRQRLVELQKLYGVQVSPNNSEALQQSEISLLAIKPQQLTELLPELAAHSGKKLLISILAGVPTAKLQASGSWRVIRVMPNTPALIGAGASALSYGAGVTDDDKAITLRLFGAVGSVVEVAEEQLDAVTALSGSGPAFVFRLIEQFQQAGIKAGLESGVALALVKQTFLGSAQLASESSNTLEELIEQVTSPGGTTAAGRAILEGSELASIIADTVAAAKRRGEELGQHA